MASEAVRCGAPIALKNLVCEVSSALIMYENVSTLIQHLHQALHIHFPHTRSSPF